MNLDDTAFNDVGQPWTVPDEKGGSDLAGRPLKTREASWREHLANAVATLTEQDRSLDAEKKYVRGMLARKIRKGKGETFFDTEELTILRECVGRLYGPELQATLWEFIDEKLRYAKEKAKE